MLGPFEGGFLNIRHRAAGAGLLLVGLAAGAAVAWRNTGVRGVVGREVFRSGQPEGAALERAVATLGVRSVVNLRGESPGEDWYRHELEGSRRMGLARWDVRLKMDEAPAQSEIRRLLEALDAAPRPLLLHCRAGADRVGFAAAFTRAQGGEDVSAAMGEMQPWAGHLCWRPRCPLHGFFREYERWLAETGLAHSRTVFRRFVTEDYAPEPYRAQIELEGAPPDGTVLAPGHTVALRARVRNASKSAWPMSAGPHGVRLGVRVLGPYAADPEDALERLRTPGMPDALDVLRAGMEEGRIAPGESRTFSLTWDLPAVPGHYVYQIDMVDEHVHWFSDMGGPGVLLRLEVAPAVTAAPQSAS